MPPKCPDCPTKHDAMQNTYIQNSAIDLELEFSMYLFFLKPTRKTSTRILQEIYKKSTRILQEIYKKSTKNLQKNLLEFKKKKKKKKEIQIC